MSRWIIEELPTELNGITMQEADYLADEFLKDTPCNRMWDAVRALRDFYETIISEIVEAPSIDICFCRECAYKGEINCPMYYRDKELKPTDLCSYGERREQ